MWEIILEGAIPAAILGFAGAVITAVLSNNLARKQECAERKRMYIDKAYSLLTNEYSHLCEREQAIEIVETDVSEQFIDALIEMYRRSVALLEMIKRSLLAIRFVFLPSELKSIEDKIRLAERLNKKLIFTSLTKHIENRPGYENIEINDEIGLLSNEDQDIQSTMREFICMANDIYFSYLNLLEIKLRKILN